MAISVGLFSSLFVSDTTSLVKFSPATIGLVPSNLRTVRTVTLGAASKPATETKKHEPRGITKPRRVSPEMQTFLGGVTEISHTQALKEIWAYIKQHDLQVTKEGNGDCARSYRNEKEVASDGEAENYERAFILQLLGLSSSKSSGETS